MKVSLSDPMKTKGFIILCLVYLNTSAQSEQQLLTFAEKQEKNLNETGAFEAYRKVLKINPDNYQALWKLSELCSRIGNRQSSRQQKQLYFISGRSYGEAAVQLNPRGADGYYALSVAMGRMALSGSGKEKINAVKAIRSNAETALKLNPRHGRAWHVMGKWHYEVNNLNFFEKAGLKIIYGGLPSASLNESIYAYEKAKQYEPSFALNFLELAKAYKTNDQEQKAIALLKILPTIPVKTADDDRIKREGAALLKDLTD
jgi:tetratricopeptide (TPR) repeat protein